MASPIIRGNSLYTIVDGPSWMQAEANSVKLGGHLTAITSGSENSWITDKFDAVIPTDEGLWIGLTYKSASNTWQWSSGELYDYSAWYHSEPTRTLQNDGVTREDSAHIYLTNQDGSGWHGRRGFWNDIPSNAPIAPEGKGIAETPFIRRGDSAYVIVQGPTWEEAEASAVKLGGHLVTINDAAENEWIRTNYSSTNNSIWIGFNDKAKEGTWVWSSGDSVAFTAWNSGEPDGRSNYKSTENAAHLVLAGVIAGKWQDIPNNSSLVGIAEIKLAPNNAPTGTPTLSGTTKVGSTLTIDDTTVKDTDNFTGYTPTFQYNWEISNDNGTTWSKLTSTDATDNNSTYTLTSAEVGKQIRGVVSYLDGYGTNEALRTVGNSVSNLGKLPGEPPKEPSSNAKLWIDPSGTLSGAITGTAGDDTYEADFVKDLEIIDTGGNNFVFVNKDKDAHGNSFVISGSKLRFTGNGYTRIVANKVNTAYYGFHVSGEILIGDGGSDIEIDLTGGFIYQNNILNGAVIVTGGGSDNLAILLDSSGGYMEWFYGMAGGSVSLGAGNDSFIIDFRTSRVDAYGNQVTYQQNDGNPYTIATSGGTIDLGDGDDEIIFNSLGKGVEGTQIALGAGDDYLGITSRLGSLIGANVDAGSGNDLIRIISTKSNQYGLVDSTVSMGSGNDLMSLSSSRNSTLDMGEGYDRVELSGTSTEYTIEQLSNDSALVRKHSDAFYSLIVLNAEEIAFDNETIVITVNSLPTGTPSVTGTTKVGSTLTIDASAVNDADNFTGYTPNFQFSWETSTDGTTWSKLSSTDATDNNNTYTLTSAEVGKQVRGVVGYLDGYGTTEAVNSAASTTVANNLMVRGNSIYTIVDGPSWTQAEANAVKLGGHLVTLNNANESAFVSDAVYGNQNHIKGVDDGTKLSVFFIGLNDANKEGDWVWSSGEEGEWTDITSKFSRQNWIYQQHLAAAHDYYVVHSNNDGRGDDWIFVDNESSFYKSWGLPHYGIAETPFIRRGDSAYVIVQGPTWEEAEANAVKLGGHLVTINDAAENNYLFTTFGDERWIGLTDKEQEGVWKWSSGDTVTYTNWIPGEPNNAGEQDYGWFDTGYQGKWDDLWQSWHEVKGGIAEIKLAPNNLPTGSPSVTGTLKAGSTLTIDASAVKDADNFTGYTPTYQYFWETSTDGTNWSKLTSTDATDNNTTYTLTSAEVGKQVRGVVSYLDGYGTNEVVETSSTKTISKGVKIDLYEGMNFNELRKTDFVESIDISDNYDVSSGGDGERFSVRIQGQIQAKTDGINTFKVVSDDGVRVWIGGNNVLNRWNDHGATLDTISLGNLKKSEWYDFKIEYYENGGVAILRFLGEDEVPYQGLRSVENLPPTGTPSVSGTLKAGSTLTIDASTIKDADNFTGYTPTFQYSWETSTDGTTWSKLTTTDATDNNSTYTLTSAEVGKQVRGVVSYLDGYGTNEVVNSAGSIILPITPQTQQVSTIKPQLSYQPSKSVSVPLQYTTSTGDPQLSGLTLNVHYNSSILTPTTTNNGVSDQLPVSITTNKIVPDTNNLDNDPLTDKIIQLVWATFDNTFPNKTLPTTLANLTFNTSSATIDPLTGAPLTTTLRYTASETASGYDFLTNSTILKASTFNLDVDGDGQVKALTDGLMIIRKLLGPAFDGDALTFKAIGSSATRTTDEIHTYIQGAIDGGMLDVDKNNKTTALTDGLMVIRRLLGPAFDGDALTYKSLSSDSPYFGMADASTLVAANIDALKPF